jgi:hypothetical protein
VVEHNSLLSIALIEHTSETYDQWFECCHWHWDRENSKNNKFQVWCAKGVSTVVEHSTHYLRTGGSNSATDTFRAYGKMKDQL